MKRLKNKFLQMDLNTTTYQEMYNGSIVIIDPECEWAPPVNTSDPTYYRGEIGFTVTGTHKLSKDKPTVTWQIPCDRIGISKITDTCADFCLREFKKYIDELNRELYNRSRPDNENGKYYLCAPNGEVLLRNTAYFALCPQKDYENGGGSTVYLLHDGVDRPPKMCLCIRIQVQLPKKRLKKAMTMLSNNDPLQLLNIWRKI